MRIKKVEITNYKCLGPNPISFYWEDFVVLVGENNVGKSSILEAINLYFLNKRKVESKYFYNAKLDGAEPSPIEVIITFSGLSPTENALRGINKRLTSDGDWVLKKQYDYSVGETQSEEVKYFSFSKDLKVNNVNTNTTWDRVHELFPTIEVAGSGSKKLTKEDVAEVVEQVATHYPDKVTTGADDEWVANPGGRQSNIEKILKDNFFPIFVRAVHPVQDETVGSKSAFDELFKILVDEKIKNSDEMENFRTSLNALLGLFSNDESGNRRITEIQQLEESVGEKISRIIHASASIKVTPPTEASVLSKIVPSPELSIDDGYPTSVDDQGHGLQRTLIFALLELLASHRPSTAVSGISRILIFEEPELYMHPQMERKLKDTLYKLAKDRDFQVICTTHSPVFLDMADKSKSIITMKKDENRVVALKQVNDEIFPGDSLKDQKDRLRMVLTFDPTVNELFFAKRVVLVEGDSEIATFGKAALELGLDSKQVKDTTLINCRGKRTIQGFMRVLNAFGIRYKVVHVTVTFWVLVRHRFQARWPVF